MKKKSMVVKKPVGKKVAAARRLSPSGPTVGGGGKAAR